MMTEIILLIVGGVITFLSTMLFNRMSQRKPKMVWFTPPPIHFKNEGLDALQIVIFNDGNAPAKNVRVIVKLVDDAHFNSVEVHPSENALAYSTPSINPLEILIPRVPSGSSVSLSCIVQTVKESKSEISLVGDDDVIGVEHVRNSGRNQYAKNLRTMYWGMMATMFFILFLFVIWSSALALSVKNEAQQIALGDIYFNKGEYELARKAYSEISTRWYEPSKALLFVKLAAVAAAQGKNDVAIDILKEVPAGKWGRIEMLLHDVPFDSLRLQPSFKELVKEKNK